MKGSSTTSAFEQSTTTTSTLKEILYRAMRKIATYTVYWCVLALSTPLFQFQNLITRI